MIIPHGTSIKRTFLGSIDKLTNKRTFHAAEENMGGGEQFIG